jgi:epoxyqueuosine reductase QueG
MENSIKEFVLKSGADVCGIAGMERFGDAPEGFRPRDVYADCRSVIVFAKRLPVGLASVSPRVIYDHATDVNLRELDRIAFEAAVEIERLGGIAVPLPSDTPFDYWDKDTLTGKGLISMRHAAKAAGLGSLGKNTLLINKTYGNMLNICAVLTNLELKSDGLSEELCIPGCRRCLDACPSKALDGVSASQNLCRPHTYGENERGFSIVNCNRCRVVCPRAFGVK